MLTHDVQPVSTPLFMFDVTLLVATEHKGLLWRQSVLTPRMETEQQFIRLSNTGARLGFLTDAGTKAVLSLRDYIAQHSLGILAPDATWYVFPLGTASDFDLLRDTFLPHMWFTNIPRDKWAGRYNDVYEYAKWQDVFTRLRDELAF